MESGVLFLDGDFKGQMIFGILDLKEYRRVIPPEMQFWCGDYDCCEPPREPEMEVYQIVELGRCVRVATKDKELAKSKDKLALELAILCDRLEQVSPQAQRRFAQQFRAQQANKGEE